MGHRGNICMLIHTVHRMLSDLGGRHNKRCRLINMFITIINIRRSYDILIFKLKRPIHGKTVFH